MTTSDFSRASIRKNSGFALVYALALVVLVCGLAVALLISSRTERVAASSFAASVEARQLADNAVGVVEAQINDATTRGGQYAWASQPGMIRVFGSSGNLVDAYKLYSAEQMIADTVSLTADLPPGDWSSAPAQWVDLNAPVSVNEPGSGSLVKHFPVLDDPDQMAQGGIGVPEGFKVSASVPGKTSYQPVPMPVRWLYVLKDGQMIAPGGGTTQVTVPGASAANPIVGRVAFWTDDETCKININTAGGGVGPTPGGSVVKNDTFWDVPRASSTWEANLARYQPATREYQRFPGHPGTVALSAALPNLTLAQYLALTPRYQLNGSSQGGTTVPSQAQGVAPKGERLYPSLDEMIFAAAPSGDGRVAATAGLSQDVLKSRSFFLTAHSRAPESTLFNTPRIAVWPVAQLGANGPNKNLTTAYDRMIAFCSATKASAAAGFAGLRPYFFQRLRNMDMAYDANVARNGQLYGYLQSLTALPVPGFGPKTFLDKYPADRNQILTEIFDYIRCTDLYDQTVADAGGTPYTPATSETVSTPQGHGFVAPAKFVNGTQGFGRSLTLSELGILFICNAAADDPSTAAVDESYGSNTTANKTLTPDHTANGPVTLLSTGQKRIQAVILLELSGVSQGWSVQKPIVTVRITGLNGLTVTTTGTAQSLRLPATGDYSFGKIGGTGNDWNWGSSYGASRTGENPGYRTLFYQRKAPFDPGSLYTYPFVGYPVTIDVPANGLMAFSGGAITVEIYAGETASAGAMLNSFQLYLPPASFPIPNLVTSAAGAPNLQDWWSFSYAGTDATHDATEPPIAGRMRRAQLDPGKNGNPGQGALVRADFDVLRTILPKHGDYRLIAARPQIQDTASGDGAGNVFAPHRYYFDPSHRVASNLSSWDRDSAMGFDFGSNQGYAQGVTYVTRSAPDLAADGDKSAVWLSGDFDNGTSNVPDGPYINKPDEGTSLTTNDGRLGYFKSASGTEVKIGSTYFSPNRMMPSPGMLGSLPTGVLAGAPWQTLLFRPQPSHPQSRQARPDMPPDYLLMDLFWMPTVEPYAISDRLSTAGKINLNYQILPFTYLERSTGMRAALKGELLTAIANNQADRYKEGDPTGVTYQYRYNLDLDETLSQFSSNYFDAGKIFKSATEICDIYMVPQGTLLSGIGAFWDNHRLTGDNTREHIYATLYGKLTTKSNSFTVYFRVQSLKKNSKDPDQGTWKENRDAVTGEYRGSTAIERFINPDAIIPDYAATGIAGPTLDTFYKWRVVENRQFAP